MTCTHQWHDATTRDGPEWVCAKCKVTYSETKKTPPAKREWVGLTDGEVENFHNWKDCTWATNDLVRHVEKTLREKNT